MRTRWVLSHKLSPQRVHLGWEGSSCVHVCVCVCVYTGSPFRVMNGFQAPNISAAGGTTSFSLVLTPRTAPPPPATPTVAMFAQGAAAAAALGVSLGWRNVSINGKQCSRIPSRSLLLEDCDDLT